MKIFIPKNIQNNITKEYIKKLISLNSNIKIYIFPIVHIQHIYVEIKSGFLKVLKGSDQQGWIVELRLNKILGLIMVRCLLYKICK